MTDRLRTVAAVLAGGVGKRAGQEGPKQLAPLGGRTVLEHSIAAFDSHPLVDEVLVLMPSEHVAAGRSLVSAGGFQKVSQALTVAVDMAAKAFQRDGKLSGIATGLRDLDRPDDADNELRQALVTLEEEGDSLGLIRALSFRGWVLKERGDLAELLPQPRTSPPSSPRPRRRTPA